MAYISDYNFTFLLRLDMGKITFESDLFEIPIYHLNYLRKLKLYKIKKVLLLKDEDNIILSSNKLSKYFNDWIHKPTERFYHSNIDCTLLLNENYNVFADLNHESLFKFTIKQDILYGFKYCFFSKSRRPKYYSDTDNRIILRKKLIEIIKLSKYYYFDSAESTRLLITKYGRDCSYFIDNIKEVDDIPNLDERQIYNLLQEYDEHVVSPTMIFLREYLRITLNPNLEYKKSLLESLYFVKCPICYS